MASVSSTTGMSARAGPGERVQTAARSSAEAVRADTQKRSLFNGFLSNQKRV